MLVNLLSKSSLQGQGHTKEKSHYNIQYVLNVSKFVIWELSGWLVFIALIHFGHKVKGSCGAVM